MRIKEKITFVGHSDASLDCHPKVKQEIVNLIADLAFACDIECYLGGYGSFDGSCAALLHQLKKKYPIKTYFVTPYITPEYQEHLKAVQESGYYDEIIYPPIENVPLKFAISKRNEYMVDCCDTVIAYVERTWGGAYTTLQYAKRKHKDILNFARRGI